MHFLFLKSLLTSFSFLVPAPHQQPLKEWMMPQNSAVKYHIFKAPMTLLDVPQPQQMAAQGLKNMSLQE